MPDDDTGLDWLDELAGDDAKAAMRTATEHAPVLLGTTGVVPALLLDPRWDPERRIRLFETLVEHARLDRESGGRLGERFLAEAHGTIDALAASGTPVGRERRLRTTSGKSTARLHRADFGELSQLRDLGDGASPRVPRQDLFHGKAKGITHE